MKAKPLLDNASGKDTLFESIPTDAICHSLAAYTPPRNVTDAMSPSTTVASEELELNPPNVSKPRHTTVPLSSGLMPPTLNDLSVVTGSTTAKLRIENKRRRKQLQATQPDQQWWSTHEGSFKMPPQRNPPETYRNNMCPSGLALHHPAAPILLQYAESGCPTLTGAPWTNAQMLAAITKGPHVSALIPDAMRQLDEEVQGKIEAGQAKIIRWNDIRDNPPPQLKISPVAMVPHKSRPYRAILDLSFAIRLSTTTVVPSVNSTSVKTAPRGAIDQIGHVLPRIIHAFATADEDAKIFMAKWDIKDGFWRLDCEEGEEWNFAYVLPSSFGTDDIKLVVPTSLQMGWIESPPYFCTASETARDVAAWYAELPIGEQPDHKFLHHTQGHADFANLPHRARIRTLRYMIEVYMDDFITLAIPSCQEELNHLASATMTGIHDVFPPAPTPATDPISEKKLDKQEGAWANVKEILGMTFDGTDKTIWLSESKRDAIINTLRLWLRGANARKGIAFDEFRVTLSKLQHAFLTVPAGKGLLSAFYMVLAKQPKVVYLHKNTNLRNAVMDCRTFLRETISSPTKCRNLITGWPDYIGITDASGHGLGGVIVGENKTAPPTVFRLQWPPDITASIVSDDNPCGTITNSDLEMAGLLMLWLVMEEVCEVRDAHVALFSDNSPTVHWVQRLAAKHSEIAMQLVRALALRLQLAQASPLTPLHIAGVNNTLTDIPSRSFGSEPKWLCKTDHDLLTLFNTTFPLPQQASWTVYQLSSEIATKVISILRMKAFTADEWRRLPRKGKFYGTVGSPTSSLWEWTHTFDNRPMTTKFVPCLDLQPECEQESTADNAKLELERSIAHSRPLARRLPWPQDETLPNSTTQTSSSRASRK